jgi:hypothetical protein
MVDCTRFLEDYSAFRDGELENDVRVDFEMHLDLCPSCARYDRVISEGVRLYRGAPELSPTDDFMPRLQHRLYHLDEEMRGPGRTGSGARAAVTLAIAASLAGLAWIPALRPAAQPVLLPAVAARPPLPLPPPQPQMPALIPDGGSLFIPANTPFAGWHGMVDDRPTNDLFLYYHSAGSNYTVQQVLRR